MARLLLLLSLLLMDMPAMQYVRSFATDAASFRPDAREKINVPK